MHDCAIRRLVYSIPTSFPSLCAGELMFFILPTLNHSSEAVRDFKVLTAAFAPMWQRAALHPGAVGTGQCLQNHCSSQKRCHYLHHHSPLPCTATQCPTSLESGSEMPQGITCWRRYEGKFCPSNKRQLQCGGVIPGLSGLLLVLPDPAPHPVQPELQGNTSPSL